MGGLRWKYSFQKKKSLVVAFLVYVLAASSSACTATKPTYFTAKEPRNSKGFLTSSNMIKKLTVSVDPLYERVCELARSTAPRLSCPGFTHGLPAEKGFQPPLEISADLPHLRLIIAIDRVEHVPVSGDGIFQDWISWQITSNALSRFPPPKVFSGSFQILTMLVACLFACCYIKGHAHQTVLRLLMLWLPV